MIYFMNAKGEILRGLNDHIRSTRTNTHHSPVMIHEVYFAQADGDELSLALRVLNLPESVVSGHTHYFYGEQARIIACNM